MANNKLYNDAVRQLTTWYVCALVLVCLVFSVPLLKITSERLRRGAERQTEAVEDLRGRPPGLGPRLRELREDQIREDQRDLVRYVVVANLVIIIAGTYVSYHFARRTLRPIQQLHEAQNRFSADASHELRTPLATMQAEIEVALRAKKLSPKQVKELLTSNLEEIARLRALSEQLLGLTRLDNRPANQSTIDLSKLITTLLPRLAKQHKIDIEQTVEQGVQVRGNSDLIKQLLTILIDNAVHYAGDAKPIVQVRLARSEHGAVLEVEDGGMGIRATELGHIFDRFYRGSSAGQHHQTGHGLGLALAKEIVTNHRGSITVASQQGGPTIFTATIPFA